MTHQLCSVSDVTQKIESGERLLLAGDESLLSRLPRGSWIGGTIPYFMAESGGVRSHNKIFVTELPKDVSEATIKYYDQKSIQNVFNDAPENGFSIIILPSGSRTQFEFAMRAPRFSNFATRALIGWVSGVALDEIATRSPKVFAGNPAPISEGAVVMHAALPLKFVANIGIVNIFEPSDGDSIHFLEDGFSAKDVLVNGVRTNFVDYVIAKNLSVQRPLVADYFGMMVNSSIQALDIESREVRFYAPVFQGIEYRYARPISDYVSTFTNRISSIDSKSVAFSCNCILNYIYSDLEGKKTADFKGPITFGEVAYQLLNQTLVYLTIDTV